MHVWDNKIYNIYNREFAMVEASTVGSGSIKYQGRHSVMKGNPQNRGPRSGVRYAAKRQQREQIKDFMARHQVKGWTQLSRLVGADPSTVGRWLRAEARPSPLHLFRLLEMEVWATQGWTYP